ncbi:hypothetical protein FPHYL_4563 [Fusarium phyllophilum]|uniref:Uncharacterized protein n=1 Tax=Fusarium phyllophilum TaxID=47803 RepID=A0A8H5K445_9HYPO|nr:hypothetical protein FPHYL_4563 [Fusarium phyllophilum]
MDTGIRIHPWETVLSEKIAKVAAKIYRLLGEYVNIWLGDINPQYWTLGTLESLYDLLFHATRHMNDPNQRKEKFGDIKIYLVTCAFADAWRGMKPIVYPRHLQDAQLFFSTARRDLMDETRVDESDRSETEPSLPTPERPRTNPVTRKHPAAESLHAAFPKQPRRLDIAVSAMAGDNTESLSTDCDLISEVKRYQDGATDSFLEITKVLVANQEILQRTSHFIEAVSPEVWSAVSWNHEIGKSSTRAALEEKCQKLEAARVRLVKLVEELKEDEFGEYIDFIGHMAMLCEAGSKGLMRVVDALSEQGLEFETLIDEHGSDGQASAEK